MPLGGLLTVGAVTAGAGLIGAGGAAAGGVGHNGTNVTNFGDTSQYDPNQFNYGGNRYGAADAANRYRGMAENAQGRAPVQADFSGAQPDYQYAAGHAAMAGGDRDAASNVANLMYQRATGAVPSIAQQQAAIGMRQNQAMQMAGAASARGPAGLALAQQNAANGIANGNAQISGQAQVNAAQERMQAEQAASGAYGNLYGMDANSRDAEIARQQYGANLATQQQQFNSGLGMQQRGLNDAMTLGMTGYETGVQNAQLNANMQQQGLLANSFQSSQGQRLGLNQSNADNQWKPFEMGLGAMSGGSSAITAGMKPPTPTPSDDRMKNIYGGAGLLSDDRAKLIKAYQAGQQQAHYDITQADRAEADRIGARADSRAARGAMQMLSPIPGSTAEGALNIGRGIVDNGRSVAGYLGEHQAPQYVQQGAPQGDRQVGRVIGASVPGEALPPGVAMTPHPLPAAPTPDEMRYRIEQDRADRDERAAFDKWEAMSPERKAWMDAEQRRMGGTDRTTAQLGQGLAPIAYEYKPGMGPPGDRVGVRAQGALGTPLTAPMIIQRPDGMLAIDHAQGLGTALAGIGHLAQKVAAHDRELGRKR